MHIAGSLNVPRSVLESACEWEYEETAPELVQAREREIVVVCCSGHRSVLAAHSMQVLGYKALLDPLEEQFNLPAVLVEIRHRLRWNSEVAGQEVERLAGLNIVVADTA